MKDWTGTEWARCDEENATHVMFIDPMDDIESVLQGYLPIPLAYLKRYGLPDTRYEPTYLIQVG